MSLCKVVLPDFKCSIHAMATTPHLIRKEVRAAADGLHANPNDANVVGVQEMPLRAWTKGSSSAGMSKVVMIRP